MFNIKLEDCPDGTVDQADLVDRCKASFDEWFEANTGDDSSMATLARICRALCEVAEVRFTVDGFGDRLAGKPDGIELCCALEAIPLILRWAGAESPTGTVQLDFYEPGVSRFITLSLFGDMVDLECRTWTEWQPDPAQELVDLEHLAGMMSDIAYTFMALVEIYCPDELANPFLNEWMDDCAPYLAPRLRKTLC